MRVNCNVIYTDVFSSYKGCLNLEWEERGMLNYKKNGQKFPKML